MLVVISCPKCGHLGRVPQGRIGHKVRCKGCGGTFRPDAAMAQPPPESLRAGAKSTEAEETPKAGLLGWLKRPMVIEGAISGAMGGILTGVIIGAVTGGLKAKLKPVELDLVTGAAIHPASSGVFLGVMGGGLFGFVIGFICGVSLGGALGLLASYLRGGLLEAPRGRALLTGLLTGAAVTSLIADYPWIALGAVLGTLGSGFWSVLQNWEQAADTPFVSGFQMEEEEVPPKGDDLMSKEKAIGDE